MAFIQQLLRFKFAVSRIIQLLSVSGLVRDRF
jgi:hypothetical protein